jgi:hypothetical protein
MLSIIFQTTTFLQTLFFFSSDSFSNCSLKGNKLGIPGSFFASRKGIYGGRD